MPLHVPNYPTPSIHQKIEDWKLKTRNHSTLMLNQTKNSQQLEWQKLKLRKLNNSKENWTSKVWCVIAVPDVKVVKPTWCYCSAYMQRNCIYGAYMQRIYAICIYAAHICRCHVKPCKASWKRITYLPLMPCKAFSIFCTHPSPFEPVSR